MWTFVWISSFVRDFLKNAFRCPEVLRQLFHVPLRWELIDGVTTCEAVDFGLSFSFYIDLINSKQECGSSHRDFALPLSERMCDWGTSSTVRAQLLEDSCCMSERISLTRQGNTFFSTHLLDIFHSTSLIFSGSKIQFWMLAATLAASSRCSDYFRTIINSICPSLTAERFKNRHHAVLTAAPALVYDSRRLKADCCRLHRAARLHYILA
jgi:hypothetical protein